MRALTAAGACDQDADTIAESPLDTPAPHRATPATAAAWREEAERLLKSGETLVAYDAVATGLRAFPGDLRLRQLMALALARSGATREANELLTTLVSEGHADEETRGLLARTHKDLWTTSTNGDERHQHLERAIRFYTDAYRATGGYWTGINAATLAMVGGARTEAEPLARDVTARCRALLDANPARADLYWVLATLGEAALVLGDLPRAEDWYRQAVAAAPDRLGDLVSTRRNARLLLQHRGNDQAFLDACLPVPRVILFAGHLIDRPGRAVPRFPAALEPDVRAAIDERLHALGARIGYAAAACGADLLFLESLAASGGETRIVLPYNPEQFVEDSVAFVPESDWRTRFARALDRAAGVSVAAEHRLGRGSTSYEYGFRVLDGTAAMRADELDTELVCLAVWDGLAGDGPGGTAYSVEHWRRAGRRVELIDLATLRREQVQLKPEATTEVRLKPDAASEPFDPRIVGLLFADAHGFSKLTEAELPIFVERYLGLVADLLSRLGSPPLITNTWGDGLYAVFRDVLDTGEFALRLCAAVRQTDWAALGLAHGLSLRIGLHAGPAYLCIDPVTQRPNYIGAHVSRAARIEPIAPPGEVYASGAFAALARAERVQAFTCTYVGQTPLAKGYGTFPTYVVRRRGPQQS